MTPPPDGVSCKEVNEAGWKFYFHPAFKIVWKKVTKKLSN